MLLLTRGFFFGGVICKRRGLGCCATAFGKMAMVGVFLAASSLTSSTFANVDILARVKSLLGLLEKVGQRRPACGGPARANFVEFVVEINE